MNLPMAYYIPIPLQCGVDMTLNFETGHAKVYKIHGCCKTSHSLVKYGKNKPACGQ